MVGVNWARVHVPLYLPEPPVLDTVDVKAKTNQCLFLRIVAADDLLAMDSGGVSDPFAVARWGSLECKTEVIYETAGEGGEGGGRPFPFPFPFHTRVSYAPRLNLRLRVDLGYVRVVVHCVLCAQ